ncbi:MazG-like family protein [Nonomuraea sp. NPDC048881]|uniref:MazG-like family protein n=1 Tax=unclassified Nonomuraea TaxID=2593643 RepID=UPI0034115894
MPDPTSTDPWSTIGELVAWLDRNNGRDPHELTLRVMKIGEEFGEAVEARIGELGQNPRKPASHTRQDLADELCDVIVTAMVALTSVVDDPRAVFEAKLRKIADRVSAFEAQRA